MARRPRSTRTAVKDPYTDGSGAWPIPVFDGSMTFREVGSIGLRQFGGWVREEFLPQLVGRQAMRVYREMMDNSPTIGGVLFAIQGVMRKAAWRTEPVNDTAQAKEMAEFADSLRFDMSHTWDDFIIEALSMLPYGFAPHEIVYKRRTGKDVRGDTPRSNFDDGRIGIRRLPIRGQDTILKWHFGINGEILGLTQQPWVGQLIDIPIEKLLLFRPKAHKNNPEGLSVLRTAYVPYYFVKRLQEQEAVLFERMSGLPVMKVPTALLESANAGNASAVATLNAYKKLITNVRIDEQMGVLIPSDTYMGNDGKPSTVPMYEFKLETPSSGRANLDANTPIARYKLDMMTAVLCDFLMLGHEQRGTQSLAVTKVDLFMQAIEGWLNAVASVLNRHLLPRIWKLNALDPNLMPEYIPDMAQRIDLDVLSNFVLRLGQAGMPLFPDDDLQHALREAAGLPDVTDPAALRAAMAANESDAAGKTGEDLKKMVKASLARRARHLGGA